jgi:hypothetical protein
MIQIKVKEQWMTHIIVKEQWMAHIIVKEQWMTHSKGTMNDRLYKLK